MLALARFRSASGVGLGALAAQLDRLTNSADGLGVRLAEGRARARSAAELAKIGRERANAVEKAANALRFGSRAARTGGRANIELVAPPETAPRSGQDAIVALSVAHEGIVGSLTQAHGLADTANIVALNASIEAARSGAVERNLARLAQDARSVAHAAAAAAERQTGQAAAIERALALVDEATTTAETRRRDNEALTRKMSAALAAQAEVIEELSLRAQSAAEGARELTAAIDGVRTILDEADAYAPSVRGAALDSTRLLKEMQETVGNFTASMSTR